MAKLQIYYDSNVQELSDTIKESNAGTDGNANFSAEFKMKATLNDNVHDATLTNSGLATYELKGTGYTKVFSSI